MMWCSARASKPVIKNSTQDPRGLVKWRAVPDVPQLCGARSRARFVPRRPLPRQFGDMVQVELEGTLVGQDPAYATVRVISHSSRDYPCTNIME